MGTWGKASEVHIIDRSAGSIIFGHFIDLLSSRGLGDALKSAHLYAPTRTVQFVNRHYAPHELLIRRIYLHILFDRVERAGNVAAIYRKSLLYFVSNALEGDRRTLLPRMGKIHDKSYLGWDGSSSTGEALRNWRHTTAETGLKKRDRTNIIDTDKVSSGPGVIIDVSHGSFDNNIDVISLTLQRIIENSQLNTPMDDLRDFQMTRYAVAGFIIWQPLPVKSENLLRRLTADCLKKIPVFVILSFIDYSPLRYQKE